MFPAFVLLVSKVVLIFDPLGGKPQVVLIFGAVLSLGPVLIFGAGVYHTHTHTHTHIAQLALVAVTARGGGGTMGHTLTPSCFGATFRAGRGGAVFGGLGGQLEGGWGSGPLRIWLEMAASSRWSL